MALLVSKATQASMGLFARNFSMVASSSAVMAMNCTGLPLYFSDSSFKCGIAATHGPHHVAQNSKMTPLPQSGSVSILAPGGALSNFVACNNGGFAPTFEPAA